MKWPKRCQTHPEAVQSSQGSQKQPETARTSKNWPEMTQNDLKWPKWAKNGELRAVIAHPHLPKFSANPQFDVVSCCTHSPDKNCKLHTEKFWLLATFGHFWLHLNCLCPLQTWMTLRVRGIQNSRRRGHQRGHFVSSGGEFWGAVPVGMGPALHPTAQYAVHPPHPSRNLFFC